MSLSSSVLFVVRRIILVKVYYKILHREIHIRIKNYTRGKEKGEYAKKRVEKLASNNRYNRSLPFSKIL